ncbi:MAG: hypothetical protein FWC11_05325 [Firmicutes bacterium]|nr:hypothetical protein [Bacillota bacterium]MCL2256261.1 hypothetical protein [Bacillota bacterium]
MKIVRKKINKIFAVLTLSLLFVFSLFAMGFAPANATGQTIDVSLAITPSTYIQPVGGGVYHYFEDARDIVFYDENLYVLNRNGGTTNYSYELVVFHAPDGEDATLYNIPNRVRIPTGSSVTQFQRYGDRLFTIERNENNFYGMFVYSLPEESGVAMRIVEGISNVPLLNSQSVFTTSRYGYDFDNLVDPIHIATGPLIVSHNIDLATYGRNNFLLGSINHLAVTDNSLFGLYNDGTRLGFNVIDEVFAPLSSSQSSPQITLSGIGLTTISATEENENSYAVVLTSSSLRVFYVEDLSAIRERNINLSNEFEPYPIAICSSRDFIFVLTEDEDGNNGILRICNTTFLVTPLIASMGSDDGFFHSPVDVATRGASEIAIADRDNNRVVIYDGETFENIININSPTAIAAGLVNFYVTHGNAITIIGSAPTFARTTIPNIVSSQTIVDIAVSAGGDIYIVTENSNGNRELRRRHAGTTPFQLIEGISNIRSIDSTPILPFVHSETFIYAYAYLNIDGTGYAFSALRIYDNPTVSNIQISPIYLPSNPANVQGIAADPFGGFYLLVIDGSENNAPHSIKRIHFEGYDLSGIPIYYESYERTLNITGRFSNIHVSSIEQSRADETGILERDILAANTPRHIIQIIRSTEFAVVMPEFPNHFDGGANEYDSTNRIIHTVINLSGTFVHSRPSQSGNVVAHLALGFRVIVPTGQQAGFTRIVADNLDGTTLIVGYVLSSHLSSPPEEYSDDLVAFAGGYLTVFRTGAQVRAFPARQSNLIAGYSSLVEGDRLTLLGFVYNEDMYGNITHGFWDNFGSIEQRWFRVRTSNNLEGFIYAGDVIVGLPPGTTLNENATIVMARVLRINPADPDSPLRPAHGAYIFMRVPPTEAHPNGSWAFDSRFRTQDTGEFIPLESGTRVEVPGFSFDNTRDFTFIRFMIDGEIFYGYVQTPHIDYDFINLTQIVAGSILGTTGVLGGVLGFRYIKLRRRRMLGGLA